MDEMIPFLRAIAENPGDDAPRLAFADWLDEHEYHERAEFIRLQIELARMDSSEAGYSEKTARMRRCGLFTKKGKHSFFDYLPTQECRIAFHRGFIESIDTQDAENIDNSGFDLIPLQALRTGEKLIEKFRGFTKLQWLEYYEGRDATPARLLEVLGPKGWFNNLEELSLPELNIACLEAGVIPQFDLPRLRNFFLSTESFYHLGSAAARDGNLEDEDYYDGPRPWDGLPDYLPKNALPNSKTPLERFVWHSDDDGDFFNEEDWYWRGPTMESLLSRLKSHDLKQIEVVVDYDDHENGAEGVRAAPYQQNPLELSPTLERITLADYNLRLLDGSTQKLKSLRVYADYDIDAYVFTLLNQPICSELESLHLESRGGCLGTELTTGPAINFSKLKSLYLAGTPFEGFSNCHFPNLISLSGVDLKTVLRLKWSNLQCLNIYLSSENLSDLETLAQSDCCPNLTTLTIGGHFYQSTPDLSVLTKCPHMPFLSLIQISGYPGNQTYIVDKGELVPVRDDVTLDERKPTTGYRISVVF